MTTQNKRAITSARLKVKKARETLEELQYHVGKVQSIFLTQYAYSTLRDALNKAQYNLEGAEKKLARKIELSAL
jgi:hypothetical protein